jgi:hypothetical protein
VLPQRAGSHPARVEAAREWRMICFAKIFRKLLRLRQPKSKTFAGIIERYTFGSAAIASQPIIPPAA